jgi:SAM-dependent methyltransferase
LRKKGFSNLTGIDPFIRNNIFYKSGVQIVKKTLGELDGQFDFIRLSHSFEHMIEPFSEFEHLYRLLKPDRFLLIEIPTCSSFAWRKYGANWAQLDAPRHIFLHSIKSMTNLANKTGFKISHVHFNSTAFQFWASEQYKRGIPLRDQRSYSQHPDKSIFSSEDIKRFEEEAGKLNNKNEGDQAQFYLYKKLL